MSRFLFNNLENLNRSQMRRDRWDYLLNSFLPGMGWVAVACMALYIAYLLGQADGYYNRPW
ncbi:hypothetical protein SAMN06265173_12613 [Thalassovita litoralis]|jgi:hypothetical protein|uniref:Uncharacterized protein n=1 Tax=Thalassovita litoralis TaxID=1010611 RepID=A0A521FAW1_9RHOB|nr:hypothetical protein [Thalassovita litoralis]SMO93293.1 hypothetical protein SAMN06265173_12613 [Thalassovita litoralis]